MQIAGIRAGAASCTMGLDLLSTELGRGRRRDEQLRMTERVTQWQLSRIEQSERTNRHIEPLVVCTNRKSSRIRSDRTRRVISTAVPTVVGPWWGRAAPWPVTCALSTQTAPTGAAGQTACCRKDPWPEIAQGRSGSLAAGGALASPWHRRNGQLERGQAQHRDMQEVKKQTAGGKRRESRWEYRRRCPCGSNAVCWKRCTISALESDWSGILVRLYSPSCR